MDIVEQIAKSVLPKVLSNPETQTKESGLISQFIAIFATKISGLENVSLNANDTGASIIQSVFTQAEERGELITKLSEIHDVDETTTQGLLAKSAPLVTGELNTLAGSSSLQEYLKGHLSLLGEKIPSWATGLLPTSVLAAIGAVGAGAAALGGKATDIAGEAADAVSDVASNAVDAVSGAASSTAELAGDAVEKVGELAGDAVEAVGDVADKAGELAGDAVDKVSDLGAGAVAGVAGAAGATAAAGGGLMKKLLPILGLIGLGLLALFLWQSCAPKKPVATGADKEMHEKHEGEHDHDHADTAATAPAEDANLTDAEFNLSTGEGDEVYACNGYVGNQGLKDKITNAVASVFGNADKCDQVKVDESYKASLANEDKFAEAFAAAKEVPDASLYINGGNVSVNAKDPAARASLVEKLKGMLPDFNITESAPLNEEEAVKSGIEGAKQALSKLSPGASGHDIAKALNIQVINFATGKFEIPQPNKEVLDMAAKLLNGNAGAKLIVTGHTDSTGDEAKNKTLSESRAAAVKDYLISQGAATENLISNGVGSDMPVDSNATEEGRFRNRRISFDSDATAFEIMSSKVSGAVEGATELAGDATGAVTGVVKDVAGTVVEGVTEAAEETKEATKEVVEAVTTDEDVKIAE